MLDRYDELYRSFRWNVPPRYNIAHACCGQWAADRSRFALYWEDESGATAAYSFWDIQVAANRLSNALAGLGVKRGDRVALILPQRPETAIAYMAIFQMGAIALPLSHLFGPEALEYRINHAGASVAIVEPTTLANLWAVKEKLAEQKLLQKVEISKEAWDSIPASIGKPKPIPLKDKDGFWVGTALEPYGLVYHPRRLQRLGVPELKEWDDLLHPKLKGEVAQCAPTRSSSSNATYEVMLSLFGEDKGWEWLRKLAANTGHFTARSRDVPTVVAKGEFAAGFAVPSYMAFEEKLAGFDLKFVAPRNAFVTPEPMAILAGARNPKAARAFIEFLLTERGQRVFMERGLFPLTPKYKVQGPPGSTAELAVQFTGGVRSYFDQEVANVYDETVAAKRSEALKTKFRSDIEARWDELKK